jgi:Ca-activated chloride channel family protein
VAIEVELDAGFPVQALESRYHAILSEEKGEGRYAVRLRDELAPADRDFELAWTPRPGTMPRGALFREERGGATYALVTLFPPVGPAVEATRLPREIVYVIDTSGSMQGLSIQQARNALALAIERLGPADRFNVIQFNSTTEVLWDEARSATPANRAAAKSWVEGLRANGGTEMAGALEAALVGSDEPGLVRQVVFLTDGSVGNEDQLFGIIRQRLGDTRLFTVGIGSAPNGHFMTKAAEFGHGTFTYIGDLREVEEKMGRLFAVLESPVLTGIEMSWPQGVAVEAWPSRIPDLYLGEPVVVSAALGSADRWPCPAGAGAAWTIAWPSPRARQVRQCFLARSIAPGLAARGCGRGGGARGYRGPGPRAPPRDEAHEPGSGRRDAFASGRRRAPHGCSPHEPAARLELRRRLRCAAPDRDGRPAPRPRLAHRAPGGGGALDGRPRLPRGRS